MPYIEHSRLHCGSLLVCEVKMFSFPVREEKRILGHPHVAKKKFKELLSLILDH